MKVNRISHGWEGSLTWRALVKLTLAFERQRRLWHSKIAVTNRGVRFLKQKATGEDWEEL
jgi:hypothetical protein